MVGHRNCAVVGGTNSGYKLKKWLKGHCDIHSAVRESEFCVCTVPFTLYPFPSKITASESRERWIRLLNRQDPDKKNKRWEPTASSRVCSTHFVDQKPTAQHPDPNLNLGRTVPEVRKRKLPTARHHVIKRRNVSRAHSIETQAVEQSDQLHTMLHPPPTTELHASQSGPQNPTN